MLALIGDTETTNLIVTRLVANEKLPEIIEAYFELVDLETGHVLREFDSLFKPIKQITDEITKIAGITNDMVKDAPKFSDKFLEIKLMIESAPRVIFHNAGYDTEVLNIEALRLAQKIDWPVVLCTVEATMPLAGYRLSLSALHEKLFGEKFTGAHRAKVDVKALSRCAVELHKMGCI